MQWTEVGTALAEFRVVVAAPRWYGIMVVLPGTCSSQPARID
jgi:hypothetical protein